METITLEILYKKVLELQRDINFIKEELSKEPELRPEFIKRMRDIELEEAVTIKNFAEKYGLS